MAEGSVSACGRGWGWGWGRLRVTSSTRSPAKDIPELSQAPRSWVSPSLNQHPSSRGIAFRWMETGCWVPWVGGDDVPSELSWVMGVSQGPTIEPEKLPFPSAETCLAV